MFLYASNRQIWTASLSNLHSPFKTQIKCYWSFWHLLAELTESASALQWLPFGHLSISGCSHASTRTTKSTCRAILCHLSSYPLNIPVKAHHVTGMLVALRYNAASSYFPPVLSNAENDGNREMFLHLIEHSLYTKHQFHTVYIMVDKAIAIPTFTEPAFNGQTIAKKLQKQINSSSWWVMRWKKWECVGEKWGRNNWKWRVKEVLPEVKKYELVSEWWGVHAWRRLTHMPWDVDRLSMSFKEHKTRVARLEWAKETAILDEAGQTGREWTVYGLVCSDKEHHFILNAWNPVDNFKGNSSSLVYFSLHSPLHWGAPEIVRRVRPALSPK